MTYISKYNMLFHIGLIYIAKMDIISSKHTKIHLYTYSWNHKTKISIKTHLFPLKHIDTISSKQSHIKYHRIKKHKREIL